MHAGFGIENRFREFMCLLLRHFHDSKCEALRGLHTDTGQRRKFFCKYDERQCAEIVHVLSEQSGQCDTAGNFAHFGFCCGFDIIDRLIDRADDQILKHFDVLRIHNLRLQFN